MPVDLCSNCQRAIRSKQWDSDETSLLSRILSTNNAPSESDASQIRQMVVARTEELAMLDVRIAGLQKLVAELDQARQALRENIIQCKTALSPLRRLPTEILAKILQLVPEKSYNNGGIVVARASPLHLTQISRHWRSTIFSISHLWSFIDVTLTNCQKGYLDHRARVIRLHRSLSKHAPLSIALSSKDHKVIQPFIRSLAPSFRRCQFLYIDLPVSGLTYLSQYAGSFSVLHGITFHEWFPGGVDEPVHVSACRAFSQVPVLHLAAIWGSYDANHLFLPWSRLMRLDLMLPVDECFMVLERAVNVEECRLYFTKDRDVTFLRTTELAHLRALQIAGNDSGLVLLNQIVAPALETFSCQIDNLESRSELEVDILRVFAMSTQTIKNLVLHESCLFASAFIQILQLLPNLCELSIYDWHRPANLNGKDPSHLIYDGTGYDNPDSLKLVATRLESLKISMRKGDPHLRFQDCILLDMIGSRRNIKAGVDVAQIQSVIFVDAHLSKKARARLEKMQKGGLEVTFLKSAMAPWVWDGEASELRNIRDFPFT